MACGNARAAMDARRREKMSPTARALGLLAAALVLAGCDVRFDSHDGVARQLGSSHVAAGGALNVVEPVAGDAFLAGGQVTVATEIGGDLILAGGEVSIGGAVGDDLYGAGGEVQLDAIVSGNARLAGGDVTVGPATLVRGDIKLSGGRVRFEGGTDGGLQATGGQVTIDGVVQGDAEVRAEEVEIGPQARISGKLVVRAAQPPTVAEGAQIAGGVVFEKGEIGEFVEFQGEHPATQSVDHGVGSFLWIVGVFVAGTLFTLAFPAYSSRAADWIGREPLRSLALGFVILVCLPILAVLLLVTIVGIPLALILLMLYVLLLFLGWVTAALFLSRKALEWLGRARTVTTALRLGVLFAAVLALWLVGRIPVVGGWVSFLALLLGIGALVWQGWPRRNPTAPANATAGAA
jgi:hypothetical protein